MITYRKYLFVLLLALVSGCSAIALTGAGIGTSYTLSNVAYGSFSSPVSRVHLATTAALKKMDMTPEKLEEVGQRIKRKTPPTKKQAE